MRKNRPSLQHLIKYLIILVIVFSSPLVRVSQVYGTVEDEGVQMTEMNQLSTNEELQLVSEAAILIDSHSGQVLYEKNATQKMYPASITKIITGIIAIEEGNLEDIVTVSENARNVDGTRVYLETGEQVTLRKLVQGLLINSGNDAGTAIAEHFDQSEQRFADRMNRFLIETVGVKDSNFANPHGLFDENHYTTAYDMAMISRYAMQNEEFREIVGTYELDWVGESWVTTIYNHNRLLRNYEGATGIKNGYVSQSGQTLVGSAKRGDSEYIAVTLNAPSADSLYKDMTALLDYGFEQFETHTISSGKIFLDSAGAAYKLPQEIQYSALKDESPRLQMNDGGHLDVYGERNNKLFEVNVVPIDTSSGERKQSIKISGNETTAISSAGEAYSDTTKSLSFAQTTFWIFLILYALFLLLIAVLLLRKRRREKRLSLNRRIPY